MHAQSTPSAIRQHLEVAARLRRFYDAKRVLLSRHRQFHRVVARDLQKDSGIRTTLVSLSGRMQKTRTESQACRYMFFIANCMAHRLQTLLVLRIHLDISQYREIIPGMDAVQMSR